MRVSLQGGDAQTPYASSPLPPSDPAGSITVFGFTLPLPPRVVLHPSFGVSYKNFSSKFTAPAEVRPPPPPPPPLRCRAATHPAPPLVRPFLPRLQRRR